MTTTWDLFAKYLVSIGEEVNFEVGYYICPECGQIVYRDDFYYLWVESDDEYNPIGVECPMCGFLEKDFFRER